MDSTSKGVVSKMLAERKFGVAVDLGCGHGDAGVTLKPHVNYLIGVDRSLPRIAVAKMTGYYNEVRCADMREYTFPHNTDAVFMFYTLEHISLKDGAVLLERMSIPYIMLTTDTKHAPSPSNHHALWSERLLTHLGFETSTYSRGLRDILYGKSVIAVKETG